MAFIAVVITEASPNHLMVLLYVQTLVLSTVSLPWRVCVAQRQKDARANQVFSNSSTS